MFRSLDYVNPTLCLERVDRPTSLTSMCLSGLSRLRRTEAEPWTLLYSVLLYVSMLDVWDALVLR